MSIHILQLTKQKSTDFDHDMKIQTENYRRVCTRISFKNIFHNNDYEKSLIVLEQTYMHI